MSSLLDLRERTEGEITTLAPRGELGVSTAPELKAALERLCADPTHDVILDLSDVSSVDAAGANELLACKRLFDESDCGFWVMSPHAPVRLVLERHGLLHSLRFDNAAGMSDLAAPNAGPEGGSVPVMSSAGKAQGGKRFNVRQEERDHRYRLVLSGELDLASAPELETTITRLCTAGALEIELDLREVTFMDSPGIRAILAARDSCASHHAEFFLVPSSDPHLGRLSELTKRLDAVPWRAPEVEATDT
jgi:anti-sigma B factor antagonist